MQTTWKSGALTLSNTPLEVIPGLTVYENTNGFTVALLHYLADPLGAGANDRHLGLDEAAFAREHDLSFDSWSGKAVYQGFSDSHIADVWPDPNLPIWRAWDFGYHRPAVLWSQIHGEFWVLGEAMGEDMTLDQFLDRVVLPYQTAVFGDHTNFIDCADPAGLQVTDKSEHTSFSLLANRGIFPLQVRSEINKGLHIVRSKLATGSLKVHPRCAILIEGFRGGYRYPEPTKGTPEPLFPKKDGYYDHLQDDLRYTAVNAISIYEQKKKPKEEKSREAKIYEKHRAGDDFNDYELGRW